MPAFAGVQHLSLTVTDLDRSTRFYTEVLDLMVALDFGYGRVCFHPPTGFMLGLVRHPAGTGRPFTELDTGLDHLGLAAGSRDELVEWERRFDELGVTYTPIRDMEFGAHLNFRDPDGIPLEFFAPGPLLAGALEESRTTAASRDEILAFVGQKVGADLLPR